VNTLKNCQICNEYKELTAFSLQKSNADGYSHRCKACVAAASKRYYKTLHGVMVHMLNSEKNAAKERNHVQPVYTKEEFFSWLYSQGIEQYYLTWKNAGYKKDIRPSVDRIDSTKPYTMDNIRLVTWAENNNAAYNERKTCHRITRQCKSVNQIKNGNVIASFKSIAMAARETGVQRANINATCTGRASQAGGYFWAYIYSPE